MSIADFFLRLGTIVYGMGLLALGAAALVTVWRKGPSAAQLAREATEALREHSAALRASSLPPDRLDRLERQVGEIHASVVKCRE